MIAPAPSVWPRLAHLLALALAGLLAGAHHEGTVLAFAERRRSISPSSDISDNEVVVVRSTDRGCHWSAPRVIPDRCHDTVGNPVPVVDTTTGTIMLFSMDRAPGGTTTHGLHLQRSTDDGRTFTAYSKASTDLAGIPRWSGGLTGPGHAIQLRSPKSTHRGRIVVPMGYQKGARYGAYAIVSDDHGKTWRVGYQALGTTGGSRARWPSCRTVGCESATATGTPTPRSGPDASRPWSSDGGSSLDARSAGPAFPSSPCRAARWR